VRRFAIAIGCLVLVAGTVWVRVSAQSPSNKLTASLVFTSAATYERGAWLRGGERFPAGAQIMILDAKAPRRLVAGFAASADPIVSFDGTKLLFAGKREAADPWQIWEIAISGGEAKRITTCESDCIRPFYLPANQLVYAHKVDGQFVLETAPLNGGASLQLTHVPGNALPTDVLHDGRILFEAGYPLGKGQSPEIYTVYSDGSGVEAYRCDHGASRQAGKQSDSGDIVFASEHGLGRFTSPLAHAVDLNAPAGEFAGDVLSTSGSDYVVSLRPDAKAHYSLQIWNSKTGAVETALAASDADLVQPTLIASRRVPNQHPSGLHEWSYANLLCLSAYTSKYTFAPGTIAAMKLYTTNEAGKPKLLGSSSVEPDGSFFVQVPADRPLQIELLDRQGKTLKREQGWWWMRKGEQRICVGCHTGPERAPENAVPAVLLKTTTPVDLTGAIATSHKGGR
jgi:Hydrazine synthase alpha subunit middle domain